jgi:hypothetical protein
MVITGVVGECGEMTPGGLGTAAGHSERAAICAKPQSSDGAVALRIRDTLMGRTT